MFCYDEALGICSCTYLEIKGCFALEYVGLNFEHRKLADATVTLKKRGKHCLKGTVRNGGPGLLILPVRGD